MCAWRAHALEIGHIRGHVTCHVCRHFKRDLHGVQHMEELSLRVWRTCNLVAVKGSGSVDHGQEGDAQCGRAGLGGQAASNVVESLGSQAGAMRRQGGGVSCGSQRGGRGGGGIFGQGGEDGDDERGDADEGEEDEDEGHFMWGGGMRQRAGGRLSGRRREEEEVVEEEVRLLQAVVGTWRQAKAWLRGINGALDELNCHVEVCSACVCARAFFFVCICVCVCVCVCVRLTHGKR